jgi:hypothetical protein
MANDGIHATSPATQVAASRCFAALAFPAFRASPSNAAASGFYQVNAARPPRAPRAGVDFTAGRPCKR